MSGRVCTSLQSPVGSSFSVFQTSASDRRSLEWEIAAGIACGTSRTVTPSFHHNLRAGSTPVFRTVGERPCAGGCKGFVGDEHETAARCGCIYGIGSPLNRRKRWQGRRRSDASLGFQYLSAVLGNGSTSSGRGDEKANGSETPISDEPGLGISGELFQSGVDGSNEVGRYGSSSDASDVHMVPSDERGGLSQPSLMSHELNAAGRGNGALSTAGEGIASVGDFGDSAVMGSRSSLPSSHTSEQAGFFRTNLYGLEGSAGAGVPPHEGELLGMQSGDLYSLHPSVLPGNAEDEELAALLEMDDGCPEETEMDPEVTNNQDPNSKDVLHALAVRIALMRSIASHVVARALAVMVRRTRLFRETLQQAAWSGGNRSTDAQTQETAQNWQCEPGSSNRSQDYRKEDAEGGGAVEEDLDEIPWDVIKRMWNHPAFVKFRVSLSMANLTMALPTFLARALPLISSLQFNLQFLTPSQISLPILAPLLFGGGIVFKSVISNLGYVLPRLGMSIVILWVLWGVNHVVQEAILRLRNHGVVDRRVSNVLVLFVELTASAIAVVTVLSTIGVKISSLLVPFFVAIALAGKDVWHNYFAGFFLFAAQPFRPGDTVTMMCGSGHSGPPSMAPSSHVVLGPGWFEGVCESVDLRYTVLRNGRHRLMVPNSHFLQREFLVTDMAPIAPPRQDSARWKKIEKEKQQQRQRATGKNTSPDSMAASQQRLNPAAFRRQSGPSQGFAGPASSDVNPATFMSLSTPVASQSFTGNSSGWGDQPPPDAGSLGPEKYTPPELGGLLDTIYTPPPSSSGGLASNTPHDWNATRGPIRQDWL